MERTPLETYTKSTSIWTATPREIQMELLSLVHQMVSKQRFRERSWRCLRTSRIRHP